MATKVTRKSYKLKKEYKTVKITEKNIPGIITDIKKLSKRFKDVNFPNYQDFNIDMPEGIINRLQKYKSIKVPKFVYDNMILLRNDLIKIGYDNWLPHIKRAMKHRINPTTGKLTNYRLVTMGDIVKSSICSTKI